MSDISKSIGVQPELRRKAGNYSVTTTATPASGSCGVQFVFKDKSGKVLNTPFAGQVYLSNSTGLAHATAITSLAVLTNGALTSLVTGKVALFTTSALGLLGVTLTAAAPADHYLTFVMPNGEILTSGALGVLA